MKKLLCAAACIAAAFAGDAFAENAESLHIEAPQIHGSIRTRWEGEWADKDQGGFGSRFEVRNARINVGGALPWNINYYIQFDACNQGKMQFLDAWARWNFISRWRVQAGQYRVPFGVDCFRAPGNYLFANRSFLGKYMLNMRQVGVKLGYYGAGFITYKPHEVRINMADGAVTWKWDRWMVEGEYQHKYYASHRFKAVNAWNIYGVYTLPVNWKAANYWSFEARFDGMTDHSTGAANDEGLLTIDQASRRRITIGSTIGKSIKGIRAELRLNYEKYFYNSGVVAPRGQDDKLVAEVSLKF